jgi:hypothetical protein
MGVKISSITLKPTPIGTEQIEVNDGGVTKKVTTQSIADLASSGTLITLWDFSANAGSYPTNPDKLYIAIDNSVVPENTWFVANTPTPSGSGDFLYK